MGHPRKTNRPPRGTQSAAVEAALDRRGIITWRDVGCGYSRHSLTSYLFALRNAGRITLVSPGTIGRYGRAARYCRPDYSPTTTTPS